MKGWKRVDMDEGWCLHSEHYDLDHVCHAFKCFVLELALSKASTYCKCNTQCRECGKENAT
jgi:hypothetical protein